MSTTAYNPNTEPGISDALKELFTAARHLLAAVARSFSHLATTTSVLSSRTEEAAEARRMADRCARFDPRMAADIYCAADRHETGG